MKSEKQKITIDFFSLSEFMKQAEYEKRVWEFPNCQNRDQSTMNVARRTCGYIGTQYWNQGRTQEIKERVLHVSNETLVPETVSKEEIKEVETVGV